MAITTSTERPSGTIEAVGTTSTGREQGSTERESTEQTDNDPVRFAESVVLSKGEVFGACQALADADRLLVRNGGKSEASALGDLFELLEARLAH
jgi:hypothetical protein